MAQACGGLRPPLAGTALRTGDRALRSRHKRNRVRRSASETSKGTILISDEAEALAHRAWRGWRPAMSSFARKTTGLVAFYRKGNAAAHLTQTHEIGGSVPPSLA